MARCLDKNIVIMSHPETLLYENMTALQHGDLVSPGYIPDDSCIRGCRRLQNIQQLFNFSH